MVKICHPSHDSLLERLLELERSVDSADRLSTGEFCARLDILRSEVRAHFRSEEQGGAVNLLAKNEPRFERAARRLVDQHRRLERYLDVLGEVAATAERVDDRLRRKVRSWITRARKHEANEDVLLLEAVNQDIGVAD